MVAANAQTPVIFTLSAGQVHDAREGRKLLHELGRCEIPLPILMDKAYEDDQTRQCAEDLGYIPVVPPKSNRNHPWEYDKDLYKRRNEVERLFRRIKGFRRLATRYDKLDVIFLGFLHFAFIVHALRILC